VRVKIIFNIQAQEYLLPHYHQNLLATWVETIKASSTQWEHYTRYNFSSLRGQTISQQDGLRYLTKKITWVLSSPEQAFIDFFTDQVFKQPTWTLGPLHITPSHVYPEPSVQLSNAVKYLCISPLVPSWSVLQDPAAGKLFIHPRKDSFSDLLYECTMADMEHNGLYNAETIGTFFKFQLIPDQGYLTRLQRQDKLFARIYPICYQGKEYATRTYVFPFTLHADKEVQEHVYTYGMGAFKQQGLGMLDVKQAETPPSA